MKRFWVGLLCCAMLSACSWAFVKAPPADHPTAADECTTSRTAPAFDTVFTGLMALTLLLIVPRCTRMTGTNQDGTPADGCTTGQWIGLAWTGVVGAATGVSAYSGFRDTGRCRDRRALELPVAQVR